MKTRRSQKQSDDDNEDVPPSQDNDVRVMINMDDALKALDRTAELLSPNATLPFLAFVVAVVSFHESHFAYAGSFVLLWLILQVASYVKNEDFQTDLFWGILGLIGKFVVYLIAGQLWACVKVYLQISNGRASVDVMTCLDLSRSTETAGCLLLMRWEIIQWILLWPSSLIYTVCKDPLRILTDVIYEWSQHRLAAIAQSAFAAYKISIGQSAEAVVVTSWWVLLAYIAAYLTLGYLWSYVQLFIDAWHKELPRKAETAIQQNQDHLIIVRGLRWAIASWALMWPFQLLYALARRPVAILRDTLDRLLVASRVKVFNWGVSWRTQE